MEDGFKAHIDMKNQNTPENEKKVMAWLSLTDGTPYTGVAFGDDDLNTVKTITT